MSVFIENGLFYGDLIQLKLKKEKNMKNMGSFVGEAI